MGYRLDLLFYFRGGHNHLKEQIECVFVTCDDLFEWIDLTDFTDLSIVIMTERGVQQNYTYFELMDWVSTMCGHHSGRELYRYIIRHPKYQEYLDWKVYSAREKYKMELIYGNERRYRVQEEKNKPIKKKFLFW